MPEPAPASLSLAVVARPAENLESVRKIIPYQPQVKPVPPEFPIIIRNNVIDAQVFRSPAANTGTPVVLQDLAPHGTLVSALPLPVPLHSASLPCLPIQQAVPYVAKTSRRNRSHCVLPTPGGRPAIATTPFPGSQRAVAALKPPGQ